MTQAITATRDDNTAGIFSLFTNKPKAVDPTALVNTALAGFQQAADNLVAAQDIISKQQAVHEAEVLAAAAKVNECSEQSTRLSRVHARITELLA